MRETLGHFELLVMLGVLRLGDDAYGVPICQELESTLEREVAVAGVYAALERLQAKGLVASRLGAPTAERGGKAKRYFKVTAEGLLQIRKARRVLVTMWRRVPHLEGGHA